MPFSKFIVSALFLISLPVAAETVTSKYTATERGIYMSTGKSPKVGVVLAKRDEAFATGTFEVSPDNQWALIDYLPASPGPGRVEEIRILISLKSHARIDPDAFKAKYGAWLDELATWDRSSPSTVVLGSGKRVKLP